jgi:hypothetical protein
MEEKEEAEQEASMKASGTLCWFLARLISRRQYSSLFLLV